MENHRRLPGAQHLADLLTNLVGRRVDVKKGAVLSPTAVCAIATYVEVVGGVAFVAFADVAFVAGVGAALSMIPRGVVEEAIAAGKASEVLVDNAYEVLNIMASLFNDGCMGDHHVKIKRLTLAPHAPDKTKLLRVSTGRLDLAVCLPGYPDARLSIVAANQTDRLCEA